MIITRLIGGLGNQMFQYAAGLSLAEARRTVLKLDTTWFREDPAFEAHNRYALSCFNVTEQFATAEEIDRCRGARLTRGERAALVAARALRLRRFARLHESAGHWHIPPGHAHYPEFHQQPDGTYLDGMFQSEKFSAPVSDLLRLHFSFRYPPQPAAEVIARKIRENGPSIAIHFRRGDYVKNAAFSAEIGALGLDYYERALALLRSRHPDATLYIFSDDIEGVEREFRPAGPHVFVRAIRHWHAYDKIRLISLCDHAIISNSTFAWWGAWLNPSPVKTVIAPDPWFANSPHDHRDIVPSGWLRLPR